MTGAPSVKDLLRMDAAQIAALYARAATPSLQELDGDYDGTLLRAQILPLRRTIGLAAVNRFGGDYSLSAEGKLGWGKAGFAATRMMGPPELMEKERAYLRGLGKTNVAILAGHVLVLQSDDASTVLRFNEAGF